MQRYNNSSFKCQYFLGLKSTMNLLTSLEIHQVFFLLLMFNNSSIFNGCDLKIKSLIIFYKL